MQEKTNCDIYIDCEYYPDKLLEILDRLCMLARVDKNNITIAFLDSDIAYIHRQSAILMNANEVYVGRYSKSNERVIATLFGESTKSLETDFGSAL